MTTFASRRRRTVLLLALAVLLVGAGVTWWALTRDTGSSTPGLEARTRQVGTVEVRMTPLTLDTTGAVFRVEFTTHTGSLDLDPGAAAHLRVNGQDAPSGTWNGPGPGGHHRGGTLRFATAVPTGAGVELRITGLAQDATGTWSAP